MEALRQALYMCFVFSTWLVSYLGSTAVVAWLSKYIGCPSLEMDILSSMSFYLYKPLRLFNSLFRVVTSTEKALCCLEASEIICLIVANFYDII